MKRYFIACLSFVLFALPANAQLLIGITGASSTAGCSGSAGTNQTDGSGQSFNAGVMKCALFTPDCYNNLKLGYFATTADTASSAYVCVYTDNGDGEGNDAADTKVACTSEISTSSSGWHSGAISSGSLASGNYWVCVLCPSGATNALAAGDDDAGATVYYTTSLASPPDNLSGFSSGADARIPSMYVTTGD